MFHPPTLLCKMIYDTGMFIILCMCGMTYLQHIRRTCTRFAFGEECSSFLHFINFNSENRTEIEVINVICSSSSDKFDFVMGINWN